MINEERLDWIDFVKGLGIILVVIGHSLRNEMVSDSFACYLLQKTIYSFHMALFFAISGAVFEYSKQRNMNRNGIAFVKKKSKTLLLPFISYCTIIWGIFWIAYRIPQVGKMLENSSYRLYSFMEYFRLCIIETNPYAYHTWFIFALYLISLSVFFYEKIFCRWKISNIYMLLFLSAIIREMYLVFGCSIQVVSFFMSNLIYYVFGMILFKDRNRLFAVGGVHQRRFLLLSCRV